MEISNVIKAKTNEELIKAIEDLKHVQPSSNYYDQAHHWIAEATHELQERGALETAE